MSEKKLNARIINKHDVAANWALAINFIPKLGEIIVYDADENNPEPRIKIGDGVNKVNNLKFFHDLNVVNGSAAGSLRGILTTPENDTYTIGAAAAALGASTTASGTYSFAIGHGTTASGAESFAHGAGSQASGNQSFAMGGGARANGVNTFAFGAGVCAGETSNDNYAIAMGGGSQAKRLYSVAIGCNSKANAQNSFALGTGVQSNGDYSFALGNNTTANGKSQFVIGEYNNAETVADNTERGKYVFVIGNGTNSSRSNAHTIDWGGVGWFKGGIKIGGTNQDDAAALSVLTSADIEPITDDEINSICGAVIYQGNEVVL